MIRIKNALSHKRAAVAGFSLEWLIVFALIVIFSFVSRSGVLTTAALQWWTDQAWTGPSQRWRLELNVSLLPYPTVAMNDVPGAWLACFSWFCGMLVWDYH